MSERLKRIPCFGHSDVKIEAQFEITDYESSKCSCCMQDRNILFQIYSATQPNLEVKFPLLWQLRKKKCSIPEEWFFQIRFAIYLLLISYNAWFIASLGDINIHPYVFSMLISLHASGLQVQANKSNLSLENNDKAIRWFKLLITG